MTGYEYKAKDSDLRGFADNFENRIGDGSGPHDREYFDMIKMLLAMKHEGSLLDIGAGLGRVTDFSRNLIAETIALEPDEERWQACHKSYHQPPTCQVIHQITSAYIADNPNKSFDVVVLGMVIQHLSTTSARALLAEVASLLKPDGVAIIFTTHTVDEARGFTYSLPGAGEIYVNEEDFNRYADDHSDGSKGLPVHRFSKAELQDYLAPLFKTLYWRQISYYREDRAAQFEHRLQLEPGSLKNVGNSQFAVVKNR
jgi:SAM-dependent methyltransferase